MVHVPECAAWTWDARPCPFFSALTDVWTNGANCRLGRWLTGRLPHQPIEPFALDRAAWSGRNPLARRALLGRSHQFPDTTSPNGPRLTSSAPRRRKLSQHFKWLGAFMGSSFPRYGPVTETDTKAQGGQKDGSVAADREVSAAVREIGVTTENPVGSL
jgi:hypothetical protein